MKSLAICVSFAHKTVPPPAETDEAISRLCPLLTQSGHTVRATPTRFWRTVTRLGRCAELIKPVFLACFRLYSMAPWGVCVCLQLWMRRYGGAFASY